MFGVLYEERKFKTKYQVFYNIVYYSRKLIFVGLGMLFQKKLNSSYQIISLLSINLISSILFTSMKAQKSSKLKIIEIFNEFMLMSVCNTLPLYTDMVTTPYL